MVHHGNNTTCTVLLRIVVCIRMQTFKRFHSVMYNSCIAGPSLPHNWLGKDKFNTLIQHINIPNVFLKKCLLFQELSEKDAFSLQIITYVGLILSILGCFLTFVIYVSFRWVAQFSA